MTVIEALQLIEKNEGSLALNYCIVYVTHAIHLIYCGHISCGSLSSELKIQILYVLNNMTHWRQCKASTTTAAEIKECRAVLKAASK